MADSGAPKGRNTSNIGEPRTTKFAGILVMAVCCLIAGYVYRVNLRMIRANEDAILRAGMPQPPDPDLEVQKRDMEAAEEGLRNVSKSLGNAMNMALLAEIQGRYPLDIPSSLTAAYSVDVDIDLDFEKTTTYEPDPPFVAVVAIMITDTDRIAIVNAEGEDGIIVRLGTVFFGGRARVTGIDERGVTFSWIGKNYQVQL